MTKTALITGITGQTGSYLAELLLHRGYNVHGIIRRSSTFNTRRIDHIFDKITLHYGDLTDGASVTALVGSIKPDEVYNLAAQSHVRVSFDLPVFTGDVTALGTARLLEALRVTGVNAKYYQASSSEMFGNAAPPQNERTVLMPNSPYACAKVYAYWMTRSYRTGYSMFATNGILFNHESPRRGPTFVTRKITRAVAEFVLGRTNALYLGNLSALRDWGYAPDYVEAMWMMLQQDEPGDYVIGTGISASVGDFLDQAFSYAGLNWHDHVQIDPKYYRPNEVNYLRADATRAANGLGWVPVIEWRDLVKIMVDADIERLGGKPKGEGKYIVDHVFGDSQHYAWHRWQDQICSMEDN
jgi:GDPmannose 4,6-dehydratase